MSNRTNHFLVVAAVAITALGSIACAAELPQANIARLIEGLGGQVVRGPDGNIVEVSLARTWASNNDLDRVVEIKGLKRLDLSFTYILSLIHI